jgi:glutaminyl-peptide cyclotransferase
MPIADCRLPISAGLLLLLAACGRPALPPPAQLNPAAFEGQRALYEAANLVAIGPRPSGSPAAEQAALHLQRRLQSAGVRAEIEVFTNVTPAGPLVFRNVLGVIPGTGSNLVVIGSHYDTKAGIANFVGANDSASSSGALLELGRVLAASPPRPWTVHLVFFDGEECLQTYGPADGLHGSRHRAAQLVRQQLAPRVRAVLVLDMIGDRDLTVALPRNGTPELLAAVLEASYGENARSHFTLNPFGVGDDHVPFLEAGMPAVDIIDFEYGSAPGLNDYWHTSADTMDKLSADSLQIIGRTVLRTLNTIR